ncbi:HTTM domain-containing protein [Anabaena cylindrica FACHB-243]|uniref:HTTM domain-containing protein n=1 Tax=Anabaena TaxID=1163 RepID=UPI000B5FA794|nr:MULTISPECIES: HTTM domain-containing protein [Anabaena]BAY03068.1 HTTM domain-containing protein [Anabaena cylindrica PCC 7122]MBD2416707.1 HTTM domain-containing protein [Anabaena cylindrica FACHB-243]MBY5285007.1 HTTM domain-containing protein [Anabaena sp. CCAP 1446/1C]MBY5310356.1 HTTM domain-containing protein [Anabaena sp. CCAP 1446/1C]MCM2409872.1 HTTM domain-containing protein [Anabaena sp. CCAP 1446/1C]
MTIHEQTSKTSWKKNLETILGLDIRSLAVFRIGISLIILTDLLTRFRDITAHYTDVGVLPRTLLKEIAKTGHWSLHAISGEPIFQVLLFAIATLMALLMLVGYRTRVAVIASWVLLISLHNRNPALIFAADDVLRALMFWAMFLPLGACYSLDSALNTSQRQLPERVLSGATFALMCQQCFIYIFSAAIKTKSPIWVDGSAVYYALSFDQYVTSFGHFLLNFQPILNIFTKITLVLEWIGPLVIFIPFRNSWFRLGAVLTFIGLHAGFALTLNIGIFPFLSIFSWLAFLPSSFWHSLEKRLQTPARQGLTIYFDRDCGFCKKVVHILRTLLILPGTPLLMAQEYPDIYADMEAYNSWVIEDWQGKRYFKFKGIAYVVSLSPIFKFLVPVLTWKPVMAGGTKFYEAIASNRKFAGNFTKPLKFRPLEVRKSRFLNILAVVLLIYALIWNISSYAPDLFKRKIWQNTEILGRVTRLDQSWSIFAPAPPRDDGWHIIPGSLKNGSEVDIFRGGSAVNWDKPSLGVRSAIYHNMQWRTYFINLNRAVGKKLYPLYGKYLCHVWNNQHKGSEKLEKFKIYFMDERTVPPGEKQTVEKKLTWEQSCSDIP